MANLQVFTSVKDVAKSDDLYNYIGFLTILWFTWFLVGAFDIRFSQDSIFDRAIRTVHLGVLVGFSIVIMHFYPEKQDDGIFRALCTSVLSPLSPPPSPLPTPFTFFSSLVRG